MEIELVDKSLELAKLLKQRVSINKRESLFVKQLKSYTFAIPKN